MDDHTTLRTLRWRFNSFMGYQLIASVAQRKSIVLIRRGYLDRNQDRVPSFVSVSKCGHARVGKFELPY